MTLCFKSVLCILGFFLSTTSIDSTEKREDQSQSTNPTSTSSTQTTTTTTTTTTSTTVEEGRKWVDSLNFTYDNQIAFDDEGIYHSNQMFEWHIRQAPILTVAYHSYQQFPARNVSNLMVSVLYKENNLLKVKNINFDGVIFINGLKYRDTQVKRESGGHVYNARSEEKLDNIRMPNKFVSLYETDERYTIEQHIEYVQQIGLVKSKNRFEIAKEIHAEINSLLYIYNNFDTLILPHLNDLKKNDKVIIQDIIINIASYRDLCSECQKITIGNFFKNYLLTSFQKSIHQSENKRPIRVIILASGVSRHQDNNSYTNTRSKPINISSTDKENLLLSISPYYTKKSSENMNDAFLYFGEYYFLL